MQQADIPERLLSLVYATQTDPSVWQDFCDELHHVSTVPIMMFGHNLKTNDSIGLLGGGLDPAELETYHHHFADQNPWMGMNIRMPTGTVGVSDQALERRDLFKTEFYNDWLRKQDDIVAGPFMMCHRTNETFVGLAAACQQRNVDTTLPQAHAILDALAPHLNRAISFARLWTPQLDPSLQLFEFSKHAIILLTRRGKIALLNPSAETLLSRFSIVAISNTDSLVSNRDAVSDFTSLLYRAIRTNDPDLLPESLFLNEPAPHKFILHGHLFPETSHHHFPASEWNDPICGALVITSGHTGLALQNYREIAGTFGATPAEQRLADALAQGQNLVDYAEMRSLSRHTVRNQMRALLHKSGCRNQTNFVRLMISLSSPFSQTSLPTRQWK